MGGGVHKRRMTMEKMLFIAALILAPITAEAGGYREEIIPPVEIGCKFFCFPKQDREDRPRPTPKPREPICDGGARDCRDGETPTGYK